MTTINEQLNIPVFKNGEQTYMPSLYGGAIDAYFDNNKPIVMGTDYYQGVDGESSWNGCNSCGNHSNAIGNGSFCVQKCMVLHPKNKQKREDCLNKCIQEHNLNLNSPLDIALAAAGVTPESATQFKQQVPITLGGDKPVSIGNKTTENNNGESSGDNPPKISQNTKIAIFIGIGAVAIIGLVFFLRKK